MQFFGKFFAKLRPSFREKKPNHNQVRESSTKTQNINELSRQITLARRKVLIFTNKIQTVKGECGLTQKIAFTKKFTLFNQSLRKFIKMRYS